MNITKIEKKLNAKFRTVGSMANTVEDILKGPDHKVMKGIQVGIDASNQEAVSNAQKIQKWMILPKDFSLEGGEMTPTMKVLIIHSSIMSCTILNLLGEENCCYQKVPESA